MAAARKPAQRPAQRPSPSPRAVAKAFAPVVTLPSALVDEFGELTRLKNQFAPVLKRYEKCRERLSLLVRDADPEAELRIDGQNYRVHISPRGLERHADVEAVRRKLGHRAFMELAKVTLCSLEDRLARRDVRALTTTERTGPRTFAPVPLRRTTAGESGGRA